MVTHTAHDMDEQITELETLLTESTHPTLFETLDIVADIRQMLNSTYLHLKYIASAKHEPHHHSSTPKGSQGRSRPSNSHINTRSGTSLYVRTTFTMRSGTGVHRTSLCSGYQSRSIMGSQIFSQVTSNTQSLQPIEYTSMEEANIVLAECH